MFKKVGDAVSFLRGLFPECLQEDWDNSGEFKVFREDGLKGIVLSLDASLGSLRFALEKGANLIVTHHPLSLKPFRNLSPSPSKEKMVELLLSKRISLYSLHTSFDWAEGGMNDLFIEAIGGKIEGFIEPILVEGFKLVTFFPANFDVEPLLKAMDEFSLGGRIGNYSMCSFGSPGTGTFYPLEGASPSVGDVGKLNRIDEIRFEIRVAKNKLGRAIEVVRKFHPYEEPPLELFPFKYPAKGGRGRVGVFDPKISSRELLDRLWNATKSMNPTGLCIYGDLPDHVERFSVCMGKGMSLYTSSLDLGVQVFVTGDVGYHDRELVDSFGIPVIDVGHGSEMLGLLLLAERLEEHFRPIWTFYPSFSSKERRYEGK